MTSPSVRPLEAALVDLFQHLGIGQAHFAAGQLVPTDWLGLAARYPECIASLTLVSPRVRRLELDSWSPVDGAAGDAGPTGQGSARLLAERRRRNRWCCAITSVSPGPIWWPIAGLKL